MNDDRGRDGRDGHDGHDGHDRDDRDDRDGRGHDGHDGHDGRDRDDRDDKEYPSNYLLASSSYISSDLQIVPPGLHDYSIQSYSTTHPPG